MGNNQDLVERVIDDKFDEYTKSIRLESASIVQRFISGGSLTTKCPSTILALYDKQIQCFVDDVLKTLDGSCIVPDAEHLQTKMVTATQKFYDEAKGKSSLFLINHGLGNLVSQFNNTADRKVQDAEKRIQTKVALFGAKQKKQIVSEAPAQVKNILWTLKNLKYWWVWLLLLLFLALATLERMFQFTKWL